MMKYKSFIFGGIFLGMFFLVISIFNINNTYSKGKGRKRALILADALVQEFEKNGKLPEEFLKEINCFLCDCRGKYFILETNDKGFSIKYRPYTSWPFNRNESGEELYIWWHEGMDDFQVRNSIRLP